MPNDENRRMGRLNGRGVFICVEGLDGCGKTTQTKLLVRRLKRNYDAMYTAEPSRRRIGKFIKERYLHGEKRGSSITEALLFAADRYEHAESEILPALARGEIVVSDRYVYSSLAYQGSAGLDLKWIEKINKHAIRPDLAIFIDVNPETAMRRLKPKKSVMENLTTQRKVREVYFGYVEKGMLIRIDGNRSKSEVGEDVATTVLNFLAGIC